MLLKVPVWLLSLFVALVAGAILLSTGIATRPASFLAPLLHGLSPKLLELFMAAVISAIVWFVVKAVGRNVALYGRKTIAIPVSKHGTSESPLSRAEISKLFDASAGCTQLRLKAGYALAGAGRWEITSLTFKQPQSDVTASAAFKAKRARRGQVYWRYGFLIRGTKRQDVARVHVDSDDLFVVYLFPASERNCILRYRLREHLTGRRVVLTLRASTQGGFLSLCASLAGQTLFSTQHKCETGQLTPTIEAWSGQHKSHRVEVSNIWIGGDSFRRGPP